MAKYCLDASIYVAEGAQGSSVPDPVPLGAEMGGPSVCSGSQQLLPLIAAGCWQLTPRVIDVPGHTSRLMAPLFRARASSTCIEVRRSSARSLTFNPSSLPTTASADFSLRIATSDLPPQGEISPGITHLPSR